MIENLTCYIFFTNHSHNFADSIRQHYKKRIIVEISSIST